MLLNKMELKHQKDMLLLYNKSLPSLKKKQNLLQKQILVFEHEISNLLKDVKKTEEDSKVWIAVFSEPIHMPQISLKDYRTSTINVAGIEINYIEELSFEATYSIESTPWWTDDGVALLKKVYELHIRIENAQKNIELIKDELDSTAQRINLFEKRLIPQAEESIRKIKIFLGDQQVAAVCKGKLTKKRKEKKGENA